MNESHSLEASSQNKCRFGSGAWYSLGAAGAYGILFLLTLVLPRENILNYNVCSWKKNDNDIDEQEQKGEEEQDTSDDDFFEAGSVIDVYSKDSEAWTVDEEVTYRDDPPTTRQSPPVSPTSALTIPSAILSEEEEVDAPIIPSQDLGMSRVSSILQLLSIPTATAPTTHKAQEVTSNGHDIMDMWCGDPLQVAASFSTYGEGVQTNLQALNKAEKLGVVQSKEIVQGKEKKLNVVQSKKIVQAKDKKLNVVQSKEITQAKDRYD